VQTVSTIEAYHLLSQIIMVWVSNYASVTIFVTVTNNTGGSGAEFPVYPKQNETWEKNHWSRGGDETISIRWDSGKKTSYKIQKNARVIVYDDAVGTSAADFVQV
jgi:hypothetical protein